MESPTTPSATLPADYIYQLAAPAVNTGEAGILFAARASGLFCSKDGGRSWESAYLSLGLPQVLPTIAVVLAPDYTHESHIFAGLNGAILRSYDGGANWQICLVPHPPPAISCLAISPGYADDGTIFAGTTEDGVLISTDRGKDWISWNFGLLDLHILSLAISPGFSSDETLFAGVESGLFKSSNGGRAWKEANLPIGFDAVLSLALSPNFAQDHTLYVGTENNGLLISQDGGKSWKIVTGITGEEPVNSICLSPGYSTDQGILLLHGGHVLITADRGATWSPWQEKMLGGRNATALLAPAGFPAGVYVGLENGRVLRV